MSTGQNNIEMHTSPLDASALSWPQDNQQIRSKIIVLLIVNLNRYSLRV